MPIYEYYCDCGKKWESFKRICLLNEDDERCECGNKAGRYICSSPQVSDDLMYKFEANYFGGKPVQIHSRTQYKRLLKQHGMADATVKECLSVKPTKDSGYKRKTVIKNAMKKIKDEGLTSAVPGFMKDVVGFKNIKTKKGG